MAVMLIGGFAYYSIQGSYRVIRQQKKLLDELEAVRKMDVKRMDIITAFYKNMVPISETKDGLKITTKVAQDKYFLLEMEEVKEKKKFSYLVTKTHDEEGLK